MRVDCGKCKHELGMRVMRPQPRLPRHLYKKGEVIFLVLRKRQAMMMDFFFNFHAHPTEFKRGGTGGNHLLTIFLEILVSWFG